MKPLKSYLIDMDGVIVSGRTIIPGADQFIERLKARGAEYLILTNNPLYTPGDLAHRLRTIPPRASLRRPSPPPASCNRSGRTGRPS
jgi:ribonucleotide monophosphatase NagD (HAD superfamily)